MGKGLSDLLCRPRSGRGVAHVEVYDLAAVMKQDHEHVEHPNVTVGTTKKSTETRSATWFWRKVRQVCEGGFRRRGMSRPIVRCEMLRPSLRRSPWMRGAPQRGLARAMVRTSFATSQSRAVFRFGPAGTS